MAEPTLKPDARRTVLYGLNFVVALAHTGDPRRVADEIDRLQRVPGFADDPANWYDVGQSLALATLCTLLFLTFLDNTVVSVALGQIYPDLGASPSELQWVVGAYALTFASLMLACGMIGDELGRKKVMLAGVGVFCAGSVLCALAPNVQVLIAGRAVMGIGAAASEPGTLSMLRHLYPDARARTRAIGIWAAMKGITDIVRALQIRSLGS